MKYHRAAWNTCRQATKSFQEENLLSDSVLTFTGLHVFRCPFEVAASPIPRLLHLSLLRSTDPHPRSKDSERLEKGAGRDAFLCPIGNLGAIRLCPMALSAGGARLEEKQLTICWFAFQSFGNPNANDIEIRLEVYPYEWDRGISEGQIAHENEGGGGV
ncbi:hypothetical protein AVEN_204904-1 [Araneus ventricosus]|uniref:Uncharacterized protein n=1 Tax=Araneus ventricosus TaxID=182803 RepID=A0A4Y2L596_ARAVE|nr:hypothetical protein AVEN_204904-1 [Araneus ventricosus]